MTKDYYIFSNGRLARKDNTLYFITADERKKALPIEQMDSIHLFGEVDVNSKLLSYLPSYDILFHFYNYYGYYAGIKLVNNNIIRPKHFDILEGLCYLNEEGRKIFISEFERKMQTTIKHRTLKRNVSYRTLIRLECYKLIKHFVNDDIYKPLKAWW
jgi:CRISPR/Cas system-associated endonuclease Cas1